MYSSDGTTWNNSTIRCVNGCGTTDFEWVNYQASTNTWSAVGENFIATSKDGGQTWDEKYDGFWGRYLNDVYSDGSTIIAVGRRGSGSSLQPYILTSNDAWENWSIFEDGSNSLFAITKANSEWVAGWNVWVIATSQDGSSWDIEQSTTTSTLRNLLYVPETNELFWADQHRIWKARPLGEIDTGWILQSSHRFYNFWRVPVWANREVQIELTNSGVRNLDIENIVLNGESEYVLTHDNCSGWELKKDEACQVYVELTPTEEKQYLSDLEIHSSDDQQSIYKIPLSAIASWGASEYSGEDDLVLYIHSPLEIEDGWNIPASVWFSDVVNYDRVVTLTSIPEGGWSDITYPAQVVIPAGQQRLDFTIHDFHDYENEWTHTIMLTAQWSQWHTYSSQLTLYDDDIYEENDGTVRYVAWGLRNDDDGDGIFETGEEAVFNAEVQNRWTQDPEWIIMNFSVLNWGWDVYFLWNGNDQCNSGMIDPTRYWRLYQLKAQSIWWCEARNIYCFLWSGNLMEYWDLRFRK